MRGGGSLHGWVSNHYTEHLQTDKKTKPSGTNGIFCFSFPAILSLAPLFWSFREGGQGWVSLSPGSPPSPHVFWPHHLPLGPLSWTGRSGHSDQPPGHSGHAQTFGKDFLFSGGLALIPATETHHTQGGFVHLYLAT